MKKGPFGKFAVDVDNGFEPYYVVDADKKKKVAELKRLLKDADELFLATDEDREGEAIAWHLLEVLKPKVPVKRMVFHEITKEAIQRAADDTRELDTGSSTRRRPAASSTASTATRSRPVLWRKVRQGLSAGRVQSVATRWSSSASASGWRSARPSLLGRRGRRSPRGRRRADVHRPADRASTASASPPAATSTTTARLRTARRRPPRRGRRATALAEGLRARRGHASPTSQEKPYTRRPAAPFTTSTLQQEASRKLRLSGKNAMSVAQRLYENGYITYMRTDSHDAVGAGADRRPQPGPRPVRRRVRARTRRASTSSKVKNAQEAHEAIRPAGDRFRTPAQVAGRAARRRVRALRADLEAHRRLADGRRARLRPPPSGSAPPLADGRDGRVLAPAAPSSPSAASSRPTRRAATTTRRRRRARPPSEERRLPKLSRGRRRSTCCGLEADGHETSPPPRYTEATLVKALEEKGIGRPSTYAAIIGTIQDRGYVTNRGLGARARPGSPSR